MIGNLKMLIRELKLTQAEFSKRAELTQGHLSDILNGRKTLTDRSIKIICLEFNVNEDWLRTGNGEMFIVPDDFSLDEYAKNHNGTPLELELIKGYYNLAPDVRQHLIDNFADIFKNYYEKQ